MQRWLPMPFDHDRCEVMTDLGRPMRLPQSSPPSGQSMKSGNRGGEGDGGGLTATLVELGIDHYAGTAGRFGGKEELLAVMMEAVISAWRRGKT